MPVISVLKMTIRFLTCTLAACAVLAPTAQAQKTRPAPRAQTRPAIGLGIAGAANHRRPLPGETQVVRWTVRNLGTRTVARVRLDTAVPPGWRLGDPAGCRVSGRRLDCELGPLRRGRHATVVLRMAAARPARPGPVRLRASTRFVVNGVEYAGPRTVLRLTAVRHR